jgi:tRNA (cytosine38-C5)-methyltransferase
MEPIIDNPTNKINLIIFEFFSGIGGMHSALNHIDKIKILKIFPFDINQNANLTYFENFKINPYSISIESFSLNDYENLLKKNLTENNTQILWTMSPPCQPFTRQGNMEGLKDNRSNAFIHLMRNIFLKTKNEFLPDFFILENVKNFETSEANKMLCDILSEKKYFFLQFLLSPNDFNIPNSRLRFYLIASRINKFNISEEYLNNINNIIKDKNILFKEINLEKKNLKNYLGIDANPSQDFIKNSSYYLSKEILCKKNCLSMDIALLKNFSTNCFTKGYTKLFKGTGSILLLEEKLYKENLNPVDLVGYIRYFTPKEILKFLCFDDNFIFPKNLSEKAQYKLLGNSINVKVVNILMNYLFN